MILNNIEKNNKLWVIGAGSSLKDFPIDYLKNDPTIGINNMTSYIVPKYHLWTNRKRWSEFGSNINKRSILIFGEGIPQKNIREHYQGSYIRLNYVDKPKTKINYKNDIIFGHFRTAGCLAIVLANIMGAKEILVIGMDGYTLYNKRSLNQEKASHHIYGKGYTDDSSWEECLKKDNQVKDALDDIKASGIDFKILTPTVFKEHYKNGKT